MDLSNAARSLSEQAVLVRTRPREVTCLACGKYFTAKSKKAQFCSHRCYVKVDYRSHADPVAHALKDIQRQVKSLMGVNPRVDPQLKKISILITGARMSNSIHLVPSSIPV